MIKALFDKYNGQPPASKAKMTAVIYSWVNNGSGLKPSAACAINPIQFSIAPINLFSPDMSPELDAWRGNKASVIGPMNHIDEKCGESVSAFLDISEGYVEGVTVYLVNQAKLAAIVDMNKKAHAVKTQTATPKF